MAERATIFQGASWARESGYGTAPAGGYRPLRTISTEMGPELDATVVRSIGQVMPPVTVYDREWSSGAISGVPTYTEICYPLAAVLRQPTMGTVVAGTAYTWTYNVTQSSAETFDTFTVQQGDSVTRRHRASGVIIPEFGITFTRQAGNITGSFLGQRLADNISFGTVAADITSYPMVVSPSSVDVYLEDAATALGTATALTRVMSVDWKISGRLGPLWALNSSYTSFAVPVQTEPTIEVKLKLQADSVGMGLLSTARAGSTKFLRVRSLGGTITGGGTVYTLQYDTALQITNASRLSDDSGVFAIEYTMTGVYDSTWGQSTQFVVTNGFASL